ncbi:MAG TPA: protein kinase [Thermoanaerobaculia bacterium]|nr:protein kinase [Thermoanaerobaculia bacterium]
MLQPGSRHGRYEIRTLLGAGGMGEVYLAHDTQLQRPVALKVLPAELRGDEELRARLEQEARAASALNHPNILTVYDVGRFGDDHFIAAEYVDGITLRQRMQRGEVPLMEVLNISIQIASALAAAEPVGLIHRDVKPDNVMLRADGYVKLLDFGLARMPAAQRARGSGPLRGTVYYMSPEQLHGAELDSRSDIWSTGVVLYELIAERLPFEGMSAPDVAANILSAELPPLTRRSGGPVPPRLAAIAQRALVKDRELRTPGAREMLDDLLQLRSDLERDASAVIGTEASRSAATEKIDVHVPPPSNLPHPLTPLLGRDSERDDVVSLLRRDDVRIVTLTGPGGTGKTRLSRDVAAQLLRDFDGGVWWVSLGPILDARLVLSEIAKVLGVHEGGVVLDAVKGALRERRLLLVLDNFEQVLDAAPVIAELLVAAPRVKALVTSRSPLRIRGEREYAVPPLTLPPLDLPLAPEALTEYAAVALFVERATAAKSDFELTAEDARAIAEICVRLDGLPLAIELAAARVKLLPPRAMLARVGSRFKLLSGGAQDLPQRHQTMRAAISWGYNLLDDAEKELFATLSVFRGGFSLEAAERLAGDDVFDGISSLLDKAFLRRDPAGRDDSPRFAMLETIREYGLECLAERRGQVHLDHARVMAGLAEENELQTDLLAVDGDNFRTALTTALTAGDAELALRLGASLWWSWYLRGFYNEGRRWLDQVLGLAGGEEVPVRAKAMTGAGAMAFLQCDYDKATALLDGAIALARAHGDPMSLAQSLQFRGSIARERGEYDHAVDLYHLSRTLWEELEDVANAGRSLTYIAFASWLKGDFARTLELSEGTLQLFRGRHDVDGVAWSLLNLAAALFYSGRHAEAEARVDECLAWSRAAGFREGIAWSLNLLGLLLRARNDASAAGVLRDSLRMHWELGDRWRTASVLEALGGLGRDPRLLGAAGALRRELAAPAPPAERPQLDADVAAVGVTECAIDAAVAAALA